MIPQVCTGVTAGACTDLPGHQRNLITGYKLGEEYKLTTKISGITLNKVKTILIRRKYGATATIARTHTSFQN